MNELLSHPVVVAALAELDPYGNLSYVVGSSDDFICFDFSIALNPEAHGIGDDFLIVKATVNSETGGFIQEFGKWVISTGDSPQNELTDIVCEAFNWCIENRVRQSKKGWNQDGWFLVRDAVLACQNFYGHTPEKGFSARERRFGGKRINRYVGITV